MLLQSLGAPYLAPGEPGSIWNDLRVPVRSTEVSGRFAGGFRTDIHCTDVTCQRMKLSRCGNYTLSTIGHGMTTTNAISNAGVVTSMGCDG